MMRVLIVKVSSLGDVIHTLPALTDARNAIPDIEFDWIVEEAFCEIPAWHPAVKKVIPLALRRWRKNLLTLFFNQEYRRFKRQLKNANYDLVIDAQGLIKSSMITAMVPARSAGFDNASIREKFAARAYDENYSVSWKQHAVERTRELFAKALDYTPPETEADYGIAVGNFRQEASLNHKSILFLHGTTWETKLWPETYWQELGRLVAGHGYQVSLLWGSDAEKSRALRIADSIPNAIVNERLSLAEIARLMCHSECIVAVDTGLAHMAAALGRPTVALYGPSDARRTGTYGKNQQHLQATLSCSPCLSKTCTYQGKDLEPGVRADVFSVQPPCFSTLKPALVWQQIRLAIPESLES